jgi:manganese transport system permease protein
MLAISVATSVTSCVLGTYFSYHLDVSTGGSIVVLMTMLFALAMLLAPKYGILGQKLQRHLAANAPLG